MNIQTNFALILIACLGVINNSHAATTKARYDLQEKCKKTADEYYHATWSDDPINSEEATTRHYYRNHYNHKLNKCILLVTSFSQPKVKADDRELTMRLIDIQENDEFGSYSKVGFTMGGTLFLCNVKHKSCKSQEEWEMLIKPYMEE
ncbi:MAG: hypothetical protein AAB278_00330 [Pseudomonadota bacterium]